jgi:HB1, ASXL, restriction endonuclease HTH domain
MAASKIHQNGKPKKTRKKSAETEGKGKKLSALDAAAQVLEETAQPMSCKEMIEAMAQKGYWSSPGGKTPASTLYSGILKEVTTKGKESRFKKTDRGRFARA